MVKRSLILLLAFAATTACKQDVVLDMQYLGDSSGAFIECYCQRGELYNLTATYLSPIDVPQNLDYSYKFEAYVTDTAEIKLLQGYFVIDNYVYSHGSPNRLPEDFEGELSLKVVAESGETFTAQSEVPDELHEMEASLNGNIVTVLFQSSDDATQNYYTLSAIATLEDGNSYTTTQLLNPECSVLNSVEIDLEEVSDTITSICVRLIRFTQEGYAYQSSINENLESTSSNLVMGTPLAGNIEGCRGIFTCYSKIEVTLSPTFDL